MGADDGYKRDCLQNHSKENKKRPTQSHTNKLSVFCDITIKVSSQHATYMFTYILYTVDTSWRCQIWKDSWNWYITVLLRRTVRTKKENQETMSDTNSALSYEYCTICDICVYVYLYIWQINVAHVANCQSVGRLLLLKRENFMWIHADVI